MKDELGERMKAYYESRSKYKLTRRTFTIIRIDGKAFHSYTKGLERPFDKGLMDDMDSTAQYLCKNIPGAKFAYVQSDEISILLTDFDDIKTDMWFDGNIQKISSVSASMATSEFNRLRLKRKFIEIESINPDDNWTMFDLINNDKIKQAEFDSRVFQIPSLIEVTNYFIWRQQDATRNSIQSAGQSHFSPKQLHGKKTNDIQEMLFTEKGINWNDYSSREKRGGAIVKFDVPDSDRKKWNIVQCPIFTQDREFIMEHTPDFVREIEEKLG